MRLFGDEISVSGPLLKMHVLIVEMHTWKTWFNEQVLWVNCIYLIWLSCLLRIFWNTLFSIESMFFVGYLMDNNILFRTCFWTLLYSIDDGWLYTMNMFIRYMYLCLERLYSMVLCIASGHILPSGGCCWSLRAIDTIYAFGWVL